CLQQEHQALAELDSPTLEAVTLSKQQILQAIEQWAGERARLATTAGFDSDAMEAFIASRDRQGQLAACWHELLEALRACQQQNRINGSVIELGRERLHAALGLLRGQASAPRAT